MAVVVAEADQWVLEILIMEEVVVAELELAQMVQIIVLEAQEEVFQVRQMVL
jgi:hypothetical protein